MKFADLDYSTKVILKIVFTVLVVAFLWVIRDLIILFLLALILASVMEPMVEYFNKKRVPKAVSILTVYIIVLGAVGVVVYLLIPPVVEQFKQFAHNLPHYAGLLQEKLGTSFFETENLKNLFAGGNVSGGFLHSTFGVFNGALSFITVLALSFYIVTEERGMKNSISDLLPPQHQKFTSNLIDKIQKKMGLWILGQLILSFTIFVVTFIGLKLLGVQYALFLALLAGVLEIIPYLGPILSAVPASLFAFIQSPPLAVAVIVLYIIIQQTENYLLVPKVMEKTVGMSPLVVLVALLVGFQLAGIIGFLIAVPLAGAITVVIHEFLDARQASS
ncbi:MAG: hypothetical protein COT92_03480 [Candidatus Doudnabacteria bacterium CG10_big_fil_rev_8_21_14_0_10_42_18]|uniref:AI-2E family transporter n=1 Tax=Candidatus Doudnabacteria bacterium CG10_big_fil_rev_8_21_14_0_10_42_18 TaxID=1974552 RepID=A0A2H0VCG6_9BACT|nr:MAG: hypothetical protein COT92_03480 [Candidatus Doudnabacteria bacterium CG10_big_fil_rev_8_21_14_0_10_42_18]